MKKAAAPRKSAEEKRREAQEKAKAQAQAQLEGALLRARVRAEIAGATARGARAVVRGLERSLSEQPLSSAAPAGAEQLELGATGGSEADVRALEEQIQEERDAAADKLGAAQRELAAMRAKAAAAEAELAALKAAGPAAAGAQRLTVILVKTDGVWLARCVETGDVADALTEAGALEALAFVMNKEMPEASQPGDLGRCDRNRCLRRALHDHKGELLCPDHLAEVERAEAEKKAALEEAAAQLAQQLVAKAKKAPAAAPAAAPESELLWPGAKVGDRAARSREPLSYRHVLGLEKGVLVPLCLAPGAMFPAQEDVGEDCEICKREATEQKVKLRPMLHFSPSLPTRAKSV